MWVEFIRSMGSYAKGEVRNIPRAAALRAIKIKRAKRVDPPTENAMAGPPENAAMRTDRPEPRYRGAGWWQVGDEKVRGPKDADPEQLLEHAQT